jgi:hypothetical protein
LIHATAAKADFLASQCKAGLPWWRKKSPAQEGEFGAAEVAQSRQRPRRKQEAEANQLHKTLPRDIFWDIFFPKFACGAASILKSVAYGAATSPSAFLRGARKSVAFGAKACCFGPSACFYGTTTFLCGARKSVAFGAKACCFGPSACFYGTTTFLRGARKFVTLMRCFSLSALHSADRIIVVSEATTVASDAVRHAFPKLAQTHGSFNSANILCDPPVFSNQIIAVSEATTIASEPICHTFLELAGS